MIDKSKELNTTISLINEKLNFRGIVGDNIPLSIDYSPPLGDNLGYTSLELLLLSLSSCIGITVLTFLRKMKRTITGCKINTKGIRREEHPACFKSIFVDINLNSPDSTKEDLEKVLKLSEDRYCPVWTMLKGNVEVEVRFNIIK